MYSLNTWVFSFLISINYCFIALFWLWVALLVLWLAVTWAFLSRSTIMALCTAAPAELYLCRDRQEDHNLASAFTVASVAFPCLVLVSFLLFISFHPSKQVFLYAGTLCNIKIMSDAYLCLLLYFFWSSMEDFCKCFPKCISVFVC